MGHVRRGALAAAVSACELVCVLENETRARPDVCVFVCVCVCVCVCVLVLVLVLKSTRR